MKTADFTLEQKSKSVLMRQRAAEQQEVASRLKPHSPHESSPSSKTASPKMPLSETGKDSTVKNTGQLTGKKIAAILVRGMVKTPQPIKDTLAMLLLQRKNHCVVVVDNPVNRGMFNKVKDYITWGEVSDDLFAQLIQKRGLEYQGRLTDSKGKYQYKVLDQNGKKYKPYFRLSPPRKGFEWKGIKIQFKASGALGYRGTEMNDLILRML
ncbi:MAG: uL30 family ribosomal protein [Nanoarchaeota archaeon]|nr:uL30 family ribosomal protein [Nanoarchaeota archaeon]